MKKIRLLSLLGLLFSPILSTAQFYSAGTDPAHTRWCQIQAGRYTIIYPGEIDSLARRYAWLFEKATPYVMKPLKARTPSIPVVLHPYTMNSNGMVTWAPKRMELYTTPPAFSYAQNWEKQLVLHETRHVGQMSKLSQNVFHVAEYILGQQSEGIAAGCYTAKWMLEGDAVLSETEYSFSGRGREAAFLMPYKAYILDGISFPWDTWRYGSYKYYTPNHYQFGYFLLSSIRYRTHADVLSDVFDMITKRPYNPFINGVAFHKVTGSTRIQNWEPATEFMRSIWNEQLLENGPLTPYTALTSPVTPPKSKSKRNHTVKRPSEEYANYESITLLPDQSVYALYKDMNRGQSLVRIGSKGEKKQLRFVGNLSSDLTGGGGKLYWTEIVPGLRWEQESFSVLRSYDPASGKFVALTKKSRYLHPSVSPSAKTIAVVYEAVTGESALHLLSAEDGSIRNIYRAPDGGHIQSSTWASASLLYAAVLTDGGLGIYELNTENRKWRTIVPPQYRSISRLNYADGFLYFSSDLNGTDNIYALNPVLVPAPLYMLTHAKYGAFSPWPSNRRLYYTHYSYAGLRPVSAQIDSLKWQQTQFEQAYESPVTEELSRQVQFRLDTVPVPPQPQYAAKRYRKAQNLFRIHSWAPVYYNIDNVSALSLDEWYDVASLGAVVFSQNTLSTAVTQLGYSYHDGFHAGHFKFTYQGWFPVIELAGDANDRKAKQYQIEKTDDNKWKSTYKVLGNPSLRASANVYIPFNFSSRGWLRGFVPRVYFSFENDRYYSLEKKLFKDYTALQAGIQYYQYRSVATRNIYPRWGFGVSVQAVSAPWTGEAFGTELYASAYGYIPGLFANQGLRLRATLQRQWIDGKLYYLSNLANWPRGYEDQASEKYIGLSADYAIPIWLGDLSWGGAFYFKRLQLIPFADWAQNENSRGTERLFSAGADVLLDFHFLRIGSPISAGVRSAVKADGTTAFQMLFSVQLP